MSERAKQTSAKGWLKGCGIGCGVLVILAILASVGGSVIMLKPFREAVELRETLAELHGDVNDFTPWPDGTIPRDRLDAFLEVRRAVQANCAEIGTVDSGFDAMDQLDDHGEPDTMEILGAFREASKSVFGMGTTMGEFFHVRNSALLESEMSLGEYTYVYALAYGPTIVGSSTGGGAIAEAHLSRRVRETLRQLLRNRLSAMNIRPDEWNETDERRLLVDEIAVLEDNLWRLPWQGGRPPALEASLAPYEDQLASLFCPEASHLALTRNQSIGPGIGIQGD
jgi:hypothetical protein